MISIANANEKETIPSSMNKKIIPYIESNTLMFFVEVISKIRVGFKRNYFNHIEIN